MATSRLGDTAERRLAIGEASDNFITQQSAAQQRNARRRDRRARAQRGGAHAKSSPLLVPKPAAAGGLDELATETAALLRAIRGGGTP